MKMFIAKFEWLSNRIFSVLLFGIDIMLGRTARKFPEFAARLREKNLTVQIKLKDDSRGRYYTIKNGKVASQSGIHSNPDVAILFANVRVALDMLMPPRDQLAVISTLKAFQIALIGPEELTSWWMETLSLMMSMGVRYGTDMGGGVTRYTSNTNGGVVFVYVKDGKILRITPIEFDEKDAPSWTIKARAPPLHRPARPPSCPIRFSGNP